MGSPSPSPASSLSALSQEVLAAVTARDGSLSTNRVEQDRREAAMQAVVARGITLLEMLAPPSNVLKGKLALFSRQHAWSRDQAREIGHLLLGLSLDYGAGRLTDPRKLGRDEVFGDFLDIADSLLVDPRGQAPGLAAFTAGLVLEDHLRKLCEAKGIAWKAENGKSLRAGRLVDLLADSGILTPIEAASVKRLQSVRNDGAHWLEKVESQEAERAIADVRSFLARHPE